MDNNWICRFEFPVIRSTVQYSRTKEEKDVNDNYVCKA